jgi:5-formyltetrahydrofolate cyclo-ligase
MSALSRGDMKASLRTQVRERLRVMTETARASSSARARELLQAQKQWRDARSVLLYAPMSMELDVWPLLELLLRTGKTAALPRFAPELQKYIVCPVLNSEADICSGNYGIREPAARCARAEMSQFDLILVPGLAFDLQGRRLGRGKGYYDHLLAEARGVTCGVAFDEQILDQVPVEDHDRHLDSILTPTRWVETQARGR